MAKLQRYDIVEADGKRGSIVGIQQGKEALDATKKSIEYFKGLQTELFAQVEA